MRAGRNEAFTFRRCCSSRRGRAEPPHSSGKGRGRSRCDRRRRGRDSLPLRRRSVTSQPGSDGLEALEPGRLARVSRPPRLSIPVPGTRRRAAARADLVHDGGVGVEHLRGRRPFPSGPLSQSRAWSRGCYYRCSACRGRPADDGAQRDERGLLRLGLGGVEGVVQARCSPQLGPHRASRRAGRARPVAGQDILGEGSRCRLRWMWLSPR